MIAYAKTWQLCVAVAVFMFLSAAGPALADDDETGPWMFRLRGVAVIPDASADITQIPGASVDISNSAVPELDISYFVTENISAELILAVTQHTITGTGAIAGVDVGRAWLLPPTLLAQYHFTDFGAFKPYVGAGVNYTVFFDQDAAGGTITQFDLQDTFAPALQIGFDYFFDPHWGVNFDVKKIFLRPDITLNNSTLTGDVDIDPWLIGAGIVFRL